MARQHKRIRSIFHNRRQFTRANAARLLDKTVDWVDKSRFSRENGELLSWEEMILLAELRWPITEIDRALGSEQASTVPALWRLVELSVRVPAFKAIALELQAQRQRVEPSDLILWGIDVSFDEAEELEARHPGMVDAWSFPYDRRRRGAGWVSRCTEE
ncbi:MAG TPA: hypothetical protein VF618_26145 [Thermoanaerobaculia bacterium]